MCVRRARVVCPGARAVVAACSGWRLATAPPSLRLSLGRAALLRRAGPLGAVHGSLGALGGWLTSRLGVAVALARRWRSSARALLCACVCLLVSANSWLTDLRS